MPGPTPSSPAPSTPTIASTRKVIRTRRADPRDAYNDRRRILDPLANVLSQEARQRAENSDSAEPSQAAPAPDDPEQVVQRHRATNRARNQNVLTQTIPPVKDRTGEAVTDSFMDFLTRYVSSGVSYPKHYPQPSHCLTCSNIIYLRR